MGLPVQELQPVTTTSEGMLWRRIKALEQRMAAQDADPRRSFFTPEFFSAETVVPRGVTTSTYSRTPIAGAPNITVYVPGRYYVVFGSRLLINTSGVANDMRIAAHINNVWLMDAISIDGQSGTGNAVMNMLPATIPANAVVDVRFLSTPGQSFTAWDSWLALIPLSISE